MGALEGHGFGVESLMTTVSAATETASFRSPADVVEVTDGVRLHHLHPTSEETYPIPIVLVPSLLSKWYVFDLHPQRSLAAFLRAKLFSRFMEEHLGWLKWRNSTVFPRSPRGGPPRHWEQTRSEFSNTPPQGMSRRISIPW